MTKKEKKAWSQMTEALTAIWCDVVNKKTKLDPETYALVVNARGAAMEVMGKDWSGK